MRQSAAEKALNLTKRAWRHRRRDSRGLEDRVNSATHLVLQDVLKAARMGFRHTLSNLDQMRDPDDAEFAVRLQDRLERQGFEVSLRWSDTQARHLSITVKW